MPKKSSDSLKIWQNWVSSCTGNCDGIPPASCSEKKKCMISTVCIGKCTLQHFHCLWNVSATEIDAHTKGMSAAETLKLQHKIYALRSYIYGKIKHSSFHLSTYSTFLPAQFGKSAHVLIDLIFMVPCTKIKFIKITNKMQLCGTIYCPLSALHVSSDIIAPRQELLNCIFTASDVWGREGSFKLFKRPFPGFLTILTL